MADQQVNNRELFLGKLAIGATGAFFGAGGLENNPTVGYGRNLLVGSPKNTFAYYGGLEVKTPASCRIISNSRKR
jgi:hypothetical protein